MNHLANIPALREAAKQRGFTFFILYRPNPSEVWSYGSSYQLTPKKRSELARIIAELHTMGYKTAVQKTFVTNPTSEHTAAIYYTDEAQLQVFFSDGSPGLNV